MEEAKTSTSQRRKLKVILDYLVDVPIIMAAVIIFFVLFSVCAEILMRYFLRSPLIWVMEISEYSLLFITFLGTGWVLRRDGHVSVDIIKNLLRLELRGFLDIINAIAGIIVCYVLIRYGTEVAWKYYLSNSSRPTSLEIPTFLILWIIPFGSSLMFIEYIKRLLKVMRKRND